MGIFDFDDDDDTFYDAMIKYLDALYDSYPTNLSKTLEVSWEERLVQGAWDQLGEYAAREGLSRQDVTRAVRRELSRTDVVVANIGTTVSDNGGLVGMFALAFIIVGLMCIISSYVAGGGWF